MKKALRTPRKSIAVITIGPLASGLDALTHQLPESMDEVYLEAVCLGVVTDTAVVQRRPSFEVRDRSGLLYYSGVDTVGVLASSIRTVTWLPEVGQASENLTTAVSVIIPCVGRLRGLDTLVLRLVAGQALDTWSGLIRYQYISIEPDG